MPCLLVRNTLLPQSIVTQVVLLKRKTFILTSNLAVLGKNYGPDDPDAILLAIFQTTPATPDLDFVLYTLAR